MRNLNSAETIVLIVTDAVFSYQLPFNLVAVVFMWPMSYILSPRWFHKVNGASPENTWVRN